MSTAWGDDSFIESTDTLDNICDKHNSTDSNIGEEYMVSKMLV